MRRLPNSALRLYIFIVWGESYIFSYKTGSEVRALHYWPRQEVSVGCSATKMMPEFVLVSFSAGSYSPSRSLQSVVNDTDRHFLYCVVQSFSTSSSGTHNIRLVIELR